MNFGFPSHAAHILPRGNLALALLLPLVVLLAGCSAKSPAWVVDRSLHAGKKHAVRSRKTSVRSTRKRPAWHVVRKGDTLYSIAFSHGLRFQDLARWNGIGKPYLIHPGQKLRLRPPTGRKAGIHTRTVKRSFAGKTNNKSAQTAKKAGSNKPVSSQAASKKIVGKRPAQSAVKRWQWPLRGRLLSTYKAGDPARQGINIAVQAGTPVKAAAAGKVVYSGNGLRGYGELVIIKHNDVWLTAYAHNRKRRVKEGQQVQAGEVIAEAGNSESPQVMLHFETRKNGKPVDPLKVLP